MGAAKRKKDRTEPFSKPQKTPTRAYQTAREATAARARQRAAEQAALEAIPVLIRNMNAMAGVRW